MILNVKELRELIQMNPGMDFTVNTMNGEYQCARQGTPAVAADTPLGNVLFRSRVLTAIVEDLKLADGNRFLEELCATLKIGPTAAKGAAEEVLDSETLERVLSMAESYRLTQTQVFEQLEASEALRSDVRLQEMVRSADQQTLKMMQRDLTLEAQAVKLEPYYRFLNSCLCKEDVYRAVSNLLAMAATISEHPHYDRKGLTEFLSAHRESFCHRAAALMQRDQLNASRDFQKMMACTMEAFSGMQQELRLRHAPQTPDEQTRKELLEAVDLRVKCADPQMLPASLAEIMRHQIVTGGAEVVTAYRQGFDPRATVAVPYLVGQGEQTVLGSDRIRQITERHIQAALAEKVGETDWKGLFQDSVKVQVADIARGSVVTLGQTTLPKTVKEGEAQAALERFFDLKAHPEYLPLAATCAFLTQQTGIMATFLHPMYENVGLSLFEFKSGEGAAGNAQMNFSVTRMEDGFYLDMAYNINHPQHYFDYFNGNMTQYPLDARLPGCFVNRSQRIAVTLERGQPVIRLPQPGKLHYRLEPYQQPADFGQIVRDAIASPTFAKRLQTDLQRRVEERPELADAWNPILESTSTCQDFILSQRDFLATQVGDYLKLRRAGGIPQEVGLAKLCGFHLIDHVHPKGTPQVV